MSRRRRTLLGCVGAIACAAGTATPAWGVLVGRVVHVGFPGTVGDLVRAGAWAPVVVDLSLEGEAAFDGFLRVSQPDKDGDLAYDRVAVQLRADGGERRTYVLYCVMGPGGSDAGTPSVEVLGDTGEVVEVIPEDGRSPVRSLKASAPPDRLPQENYLILSLSDRAIGRVANLEGPDQQDKFDRPVRVAHLKPSELPDRWHALEIVDAIVWDAADATQMTGAQLDALVTWVRQGGQLLIAASKTADTIAQAKRLADVLPVKVGKVETTRDLGGVRTRLLGDAADEEASKYLVPLPVARCEPVTGAQTLVFEKALGSPLVVERRVDRGRVVFVAAELDDLMGEQGLTPVTFFKGALHLRGRRASDDSAMPAPAALFPVLEQTVGFRRSTGLYLLAAVLFSIAYVGVATFGSWGFLRSRGWTRHAWSSFAVVAGAASVLSWLVVQGMRGVGQSLQQLTVVDAAAGQTAATATAYFGLKTGLDTTLDVWMPADYAEVSEPERTQCMLKPMPSSVSEFSSGSTYSDPQRYRLVPASALIEDVPVRATLKQFEGRWVGQLRRMIESNVRVGPVRDETGEAEGILDGSTVTNKLGHPLRNCYLVQPFREAFFGARLADFTPRDKYVYVHRVGDLADGETVDLAARIYSDRETGGRQTVEKWSTHLLGEFHEEWGTKFRPTNVFGGGSDVVESFRLEDYQDALLMLSLLGEHLPSNIQAPMAAEFDFSRWHCGQLDRSDELTTDRVLLIGFTDEQGPVMLCTRSGGGSYRALPADEAHTMYRFWIPVKRM